MKKDNFITKEPDAEEVSGSFILRLLPAVKQEWKGENIFRF